ncbi:hypothetical protein QFC22_002858 [Naganishia vaughanmartiniae]|uniref:Uncharacterized protein n=1 Tax=Naganishia vaughanmartiniae TaxID=1424756 RepID=A0ACC2XA83_9TREE|nr:hypothetical protein QFC22_002858 [Naganishia vaughanmartiniae]
MMNGAPKDRGPYLVVLSGRFARHFPYSLHIGYTCSVPINNTCLYSIVPIPTSSMEVPPPSSAPEHAALPSPSIRNVLVILPSITRGFQPKNYTAPAYANIGRSPSLPAADVFFANNPELRQAGTDRLSKPRLSIAYGHAASAGRRPLFAGSPLHVAQAANEESQGDESRDTDDEDTPPHPVSSGHLSPAARKEITAQLANPITPNSLPTDTRRQSISTLLPAGVMSAKLSQLILEEEEANSRMEQARNSAFGIPASPTTAALAPYSMSGGRPETISEASVEPDDTNVPTSSIGVSPQRRPFPFARSNSNSATVSPALSPLSPFNPTFTPSTTSAPSAPKMVRRGRSRPHTSAAALSSASVPAFGAKSGKSSIPADPAKEKGSASGRIANPETASVAGTNKWEELRRKRAVVTGAPGWEGEEVVNTLREDGIQGASRFIDFVVGILANIVGTYSFHVESRFATRPVYRPYPFPAHVINERTRDIPRRQTNKTRTNHHGPTLGFPNIAFPQSATHTGHHSIRHLLPAGFVGSSQKDRSGLVAERITYHRRSHGTVVGTCPFWRRRRDHSENTNDVCDRLLCQSGAFSKCGCPMRTGGSDWCAPAAV